MSIGQLLTPELLLTAYRQGYFPMADEITRKIYWHSPDPRAIFKLDEIKMPRSMRQFIKKNDVRFKVDMNFEQVIKNCADREQTWISDELIYVFMEFHQMGFAHSVETYIGNNLVGGLYGVAIGGGFFGESMFNKVSNASKAAFYYLCYRLNERGYILLDSQYINNFTASLGAIEVPRVEYLKLLYRALYLPCSFSD